MPSEVHLGFHNLFPLVDIKRIKFKTDGGDATVELIDAKNNRAYSVLNMESDPEDLCSIHGTYASYLETLEARTVEFLCVEGLLVEEFSEANQVLSCLEGLRTLVLSNSSFVLMDYTLALAPYPDDSFGGEEGTNKWPCPMLDSLILHTHDLFDNFGSRDLAHLPDVAQKRKEGGMPLRSVSLFIRKPWDEKRHGTMESRLELNRLREYVERLEVVVGDDALDWDADEYLFGGLPDVRRYRCAFEEQRN
jgi:hypothetical protein